MRHVNVVCLIGDFKLSEKNMVLLQKIVTRANMWKIIAIFGIILPHVLGSSPKIAIIGGGIGGTSCGYFLRKLFTSNVSITLFEQDLIGGRLRTEIVKGNSYEAGGSVIHPRNEYLLEFAKILDLKHREPHGSLFGLYNGKNFVFEESSWSISTLAHLLWRYGLDIYRLNHLISELLNNFTRIYEVQNQGIAFSTVAELLKTMHPPFWNLTQESLSMYLKAEGFSDLFLKELVEAVMLVNYGQTTNITAFAGMVSLAGAESGLWSIKGGNKLVPERLLEKSMAKVVHGSVTEISLQKTDLFSLTWKDNLQDNSQTETYDIVILSAPIIKDSSGIKFTNFTKELNVYGKPYHRTVTTFVCGKLNSSAFHLHSVPDEILTNNNSLIFNSISVVSPVDDSSSKAAEKVYKIFSKNPLTKEQIDILFDDIKEIKIKDWMAYPHYSPQETFPPFLLHPGLYYTNAIEWVASAMEMSVIGGRNVALLAYNIWNNKIDLINKGFKFRNTEL